MNIFNLAGTYKAKRHQTGLKDVVLSLVFGGMFIVVMIPLSNSNRTPAGWENVSGQVVETSERRGDDSTLYTAIVEYRVDGQAYRVASNVSSSWQPTMGDSRKVTYNPAKPSESKLIEEGILPNLIFWLFPGIGSLWIILTVYSYLKSKNRTRQIQNLVSSGTKVTGVLIDIKTPFNQANDTYQIVVSATDVRGVVQNYVSDPVSGIGALGLSDFRTQPIPIDVYVDRSNPDKYYVDVSDIPNLTPERIQQLVQSAQTPQRPAPAPAQAMQG